MCPIGQRPPSEVSHSLETILASTPVGAQQTASITRSIIGSAAGQRALRKDIIIVASIYVPFMRSAAVATDDENPATLR